MSSDADGPSPQTPGLPAGAGAGPQDSLEPDTQDSPQLGSAQEGPEQDGPAPTAGPSGSASPPGTPGAGYSAVPTGGPGAAGSTPSRQAAVTTRQAEPVAEAAKVWLGVGLLGSAGAAGLVFFRIRRI